MNEIEPQVESDRDAIRKSQSEIRNSSEIGSDEIRRPKSERRNSNLIIFDDVSKFYGEILGVNRVNLQIAPGITSLVGPNGVVFFFQAEVVIRVLYVTGVQTCALPISGHPKSAARQRQARAVGQPDHHGRWA